MRKNFSAGVLVRTSTPMIPAASSIANQPFGTTPAGVSVERYILRNTRGMETRIMTFGGIVTHLTAPDRNGHYADVVLGYDGFDGYLKKNPHFGALTGRYANRIAGARFELNGVE